MSILILARGQRAGAGAWHSRDDWLASVEEGLLSLEGSTHLSRLHVAAHKVLAVAMHDAGTATPRTGGDVATAHETVARALAFSKRVVQRARAWLIDRGFMRVVAEGRYLTADERVAAGNGQLRAASTRALTHPPGSPRIRLHRRRGHLPRERSSTHGPPVSERSPRRAVDRSTRPMWAQRLAGQVARRMPWLVEHRHVGQLVTGLMNLALPPGVTAGELLRTIDARARPAPPGGEVRDAMAWFLHQARSVQAELLEQWEKPTGPLDHVHDFRAVHAPGILGCLTCPATRARPT